MRMYGRVAPGIGMSVGPLGILFYVVFVLPVVFAVAAIVVLVKLIALLGEACWRGWQHHQARKTMAATGARP